LLNRVKKDKAYASITEHDRVVGTRTVDSILIAPLLEIAMFILRLQLFCALFVDLQMQASIGVIDEV